MATNRFLSNTKVTLPYQDFNFIAMMELHNGVEHWEGGPEFTHGVFTGQTGFVIIFRLPFAKVRVVWLCLGEGFWRRPQIGNCSAVVTLLATRRFNGKSTAFPVLSRLNRRFDAAGAAQ
jgi:hypothetical protein